ncbi:hypothetical protein F2Q68_00006976 [Brassica cretica]|uniref:RNase H type-1 domain-containing protein n=1 Tax=Brassica cretica TaxID=69181 RepID=A0A8S9KQE0_BRACR|nr:hypothetical protein F2Q68_00006976 [Brassica cretica]
MILKAIKLAKEWQSAQPSQPSHMKNVISPKDCPNSIPQVPTNSLICFSDAAWISSSGDSGLGWVAKDPDGTVRFQGSDTRQCVASALMAEAMALKSSLSLAISSGFKDVVCFTDSKSLVGLLTGTSSVVALKGIIHDISVLSSSLNSTSYQFISRDCNSDADRLAKDALFLFSDSPSRIRTFVSNV